MPDRRAGRTSLLPALLLALIAGLAAPRDAFAEEAPPAEQIVDAEGISTVEGDDLAAARDRAIDDALRKAVGQAVGTLIESETIVQNYQVLNDSIYARTKGFIRTYRVVSEKQEGVLYRVTVAATVAVGDVKEDLQALGLLIKRMRRPRVIVMIPEDNLHDSGWWWRWASNIGTVETAVIGALKGKEFTVMDAVTVRRSIDNEAALRAVEGDLKAAQAIALQTGAEVIITGQAVAQQAGGVGGSSMRSYQASVNARAVKADTGEILGTAAGSGKAVHLDSAAGGTEALKQAASMMASDLISQITRQWVEESSGSRMIALSVIGLSKGFVDDLAARLKGTVRGVVEVYQREYAAGAARLDVDFKGDGETLSAAVRRMEIEGGRLEVTAVTPNKVDVKFVPSGP